VKSSSAAKSSNSVSSFLLALFWEGELEDKFEAKEDIFLVPRLIVKSASKFLLIA